MKRIPALLFGAGLLVGLVFFFPFYIFSAQLQQLIYRRSGIEVQLGDLRLGTGLGMGLGKGGVLALRGTNVNITMPSGSRPLTCQHFTLSPQPWALLLARVRVGLDCETEKNGSLTAVATLSPAWAPERLKADVYMDDMNLALLEPLAGLMSYQGVIDGRATIAMPLVQGLARLPDVEWNATGQKVVLPALSSDFLHLPTIPLDEISTHGRLANGKADIEELKFGSKSSPVQGQIHGNLQLDRRGFPTGADLTGSLRTDGQFEKTQLKDMNLDLLFGPVKPSGAREFRKTSQGSLLGLLMNPPLDK